jgi:hypothetical protein
MSRSGPSSSSYSQLQQQQHLQQLQQQQQQQQQQQYGRAGIDPGVSRAAAELALKLAAGRHATGVSGGYDARYRR